MSYEYESMMGLGAETQASDVLLEDNVVGPPIAVNDQEAPFDPGGNSNGLAIGLGLSAIAALFLGVLAFGLAMPFGLGALGAAVMAPEGHRKEAAKRGAIYGGLAGIGAGIVLTIVSGALNTIREGSGRYIGGSGLVPVAVGLYIGYKERERLRIEGRLS